MKEESTARKLAGRLLCLLIKLNYWLPKNISYGLSLISNKISFYFKTKLSRTVNENIDLCFPELNKKQKTDLLNQYLKQNALMSKETAIAWLGSKTEINQLFHKVSGQSILDQLNQRACPVVIAVPHIGNWEFFWHWLQINYPAISMYSPAKFKALDELMLTARKKFGGQPYATDKKGLSHILKGLKKGSIMMILPDQAPYIGAGEYAPFFNHPAYTMTLLHKLISKTQAQLLFATCLRNQSGQFDISITKPKSKVLSSDLALFNRELNAQLEQIIRQTPEQYLWNYKRFKRQPMGKELYSFEIKRRERHSKNT